MEYNGCYEQQQGSVSMKTLILAHYKCSYLLNILQFEHPMRASNQNQYYISLCFQSAAVLHECVPHLECDLSLLVFTEHLSHIVTHQGRQLQAQRNTINWWEEELQNKFTRFNHFITTALMCHTTQYCIPSGFVRKSTMSFQIKI